jgi:hypothetical protein
MQIPARDIPVQGDLELVADPGHEVIRDIQSILKQAIGSAQWKATLLRRVTEQWKSLSANRTTVGHSVLLDRIFASADPPVPADSVELVGANLRFLLAAQSSSSQVSQEVALLDFVNLTLRFGFLERIAQSVYEISSTAAMRHCQRATDPCFAAWLLPSSDRSAAATILTRFRSARTPVFSSMPTGTSKDRTRGRIC